jgi:hypothetical protein
MNSIGKYLVVSMMTISAYSVAGPLAPAIGVLTQIDDQLGGLHATGGLPNFGLNTLPLESLALWGSLSAINGGSLDLEMLPIDPASLSSIGSSGQVATDLVSSRINVVVNFVGSLPELLAQ